MKRRHLLAAATSVIASPSIVRAQGTSGALKTVKFVPNSDLTVLDPHWTSPYVVRNHGFLVFDTLYGVDEQSRASPQMVAGHVTENDGRLWRLTLRDNLFFHDGSPVLARDCVASIKRWAKKDSFGQALMAATDELTFDGDKVIVFRLKTPFPLLPDALGKSTSYMPAIMPERLATTDASVQVTEMVGSGPFRFVAAERVSGSLAVYSKFDRYVPRQGRTPSGTAGPKIVHVDRVEWRTMPDPSTAAAAIQTGEVDWWEYVASDLLPLLRRTKNVKTEILDPTGSIGVMRLNHLQPPFDNPAIRRAVLGAIDQADFMQATVGTDADLWRDKVGFFCPGTPLASQAGIGELSGSPDMAKVKANLAAAGYKGEKVVVLAASDFPTLKALADVGADTLTRAGLNVDYQVLDWGTLVTRRTNKGPVDQGGWSAFFTTFSGTDMLNPAGHIAIRGNGTDAWFGWPSSQRLEGLRQQWFADSDQAAQKVTAEAMQKQAATDVPYVPLGQFFVSTAYRSALSGILKGFPVFWNVQKSA